MTLTQASKNQENRDFGINVRRSGVLGAIQTRHRYQEARKQLAANDGVHPYIVAQNAALARGK